MATRNVFMKTGTHQNSVVLILDLCGIERISEHTLHKLLPSICGKGANTDASCTEHIS